MKFICANCDYKTNNKSNFNRHIKGSRHDIIKVIDNDVYVPGNTCDVSKKESIDNSVFIPENIHEMQNNRISEKGLIKCSYCDMEFKRASNLTRHKNKCVEIKLKMHFDEYQTQLKLQELQMKLGFLEKNNQELKQLIKSGNIGNTYNISIKNYIQQNYPDAPPLEYINNCNELKYNNYDNNDNNDNNNNNDNDNDNDNEDDFIDILVYNYNHNFLHKYLGDFIIKHYKKTDPMEQSVWSSDTSRLTYIIKELLVNNSSIWNHDYKGIKTKNYIINPLLKYIKKYIDEYWVNNLDSFKTSKISELNKIQNIYETLYKIKKDIDNDILGMDIIKYIAPYFYVNKNELNSNPIDYYDV